MMKTKIQIVILAACVTVILLAIALSARAQTHMDRSQAPLAQTLVSHPDSTVTASPTAMPTPANASKIVYYLCQNTGATNPARVGDANVSATQGILLPVCTTNQCLPIPIPVNGTLYSYSTSGTTVGCQEVTVP
jgi:hypothetical protein